MVQKSQRCGATFSVLHPRGGRFLFVTALVWMLICGPQGLSVAKAQTAHNPPSSELQQAAPVFWVLTVSELSLISGLGLVAVTAFAADWLFAGSGSANGSGELMAGILGGAAIMGIGAGFASMQQGWDPRWALALHLGLWSGVAAAAGGVIWGNEMDTQNLWPALALGVGGGVMGALLGGAIAWTFVDTELEAGLIYAAPLVSALALLGVWVVGSLPGQGEPENAALSFWAAGSAPLLFALLSVAGISTVQAVE